jgi:hypothetical protein
MGIGSGRLDESEQARRERVAWLPPHRGGDVRKGRGQPLSDWGHERTLGSEEHGLCHLADILGVNVDVR